MSHFPHCSVVVSLLNSKRSIPMRTESFACDSFLAFDLFDDEAILVHCKALYALYMAFNGLRHGAPVPSNTQICFNQQFVMS